MSNQQLKAKTSSPSEMRAVAVFPKEREIKLITLKTPRITKPDQVKVRMLDIGICGTDREICSFEYGAPPEGSDYLVIGHESLGEVVEIGPKVSRVKAGDLVVMTVRRPCPHKSCRPCRSGYPDFCNTGDYIERGIKGEHGFMSDFVVENERYLHIVPRRLRSVAVLTEPLTIAEKALDQTLDILHRLPWLEILGVRSRHQLKVNSVVLGAGAVGLLGAMVLVEAGSNTYVYALDPAPNPSSDIVESVGGKYYSQGRIPDETRKALFGRIHIIYEATGASRLVFDALRFLGHNSEFILTGVPSLKGPFEIDGDQLMRNVVLKNQVIFGTVNASPENFDEAIHDIGVFQRRWPKALRSLITQHLSVEDAPDTLGRSGKGIKTVVDFDASRVKE
jgi:glucose 1-dehydrogenase